jgi:hypothetical protein
MKAKPATRCAPRIITNGIKVSNSERPVEERGEQVRADDRPRGEEGRGQHGVVA